ncbi:MAG TPA: hypothetical protein VJ960_09905 [Oceanipulchritudo sp.]|nr:hypothetical protein [Oceanipulchritudo sp.]
MISTIIKRASLTVFTLLALSLQGAEAPEAGAPADDRDEWDELLLESEDLLDWSADPLDDLLLEPESMILWSVTLKAGTGSSNNYLKRRNPVSSTYATFEGDLFFNALLENSSITFLLFAEATAYERGTQTNNESIGFLNANWTRFAVTWAYGIETDLFYGDQIFDASLALTAPPEGESFRQFRPELSLFTEWQPGRRDLLRLEAGLRRATFEEAAEDYWRPQLKFIWDRKVSSWLALSSELSTYREFYDEELSRQPNGLLLNPARKLEIHGARFLQELTLEPAFIPGFKIVARIGYRWEDSLEGSHEDVTRLDASLRSSLKTAFADFRATGRWQGTRYDERQVDFIDKRTLRRTYRALDLEVERDLPLGFSLTARAEWSEFQSRSETETFSEERLEVLLGWAY